jgi:hypothetical protein
MLTISGGEQIECVGYADNSRPQRDFSALESSWKSAPVKMFVMGINDLGGLLQKRNPPQLLISAEAVLIRHRCSIASWRFRSKICALRGIWLSNVAKKNTPSHFTNLIGGNAHGAGNRDAECRNQFGMAFAVRVLAR